MLTLDLDFRVQREIATYEHLTSGGNARGDTFIVTISNRDSMNIIIFLLPLLVDFDEAEVTSASMAECVGVSADVESHMPELSFDLFDQMAVRHREMRFCRGWSGCAVHLSAFH